MQTYRYSTRIGGLTIQWSRLGHPAFMVNVAYLNHVLVPDIILWREYPEYPFCYRDPSSDEPLARGTMRFIDHADGGAPELEASLWDPVKEDMILDRYDPSPIPDPVVPPPPTPSPPVPDEELLISAGQTNYRDLFPYIFVRPHPPVGNYDKETQFIAYIDTGCGEEYKKFHDELVAEREKEDPKEARNGMIEAATSFLEGGEPYTGQFVSNIAELQTILRHYPSVYRDIQKESDITFDTLTDIVDRALGGWEEVAKKIQEEKEDSSYQNEMERVWESLFALSIMTAYDSQLSEDLIETLVIARLIETIIAEEPPIPDNDVSRRVNANILLPPEIFPLPSAIPAKSDEWAIPYAVGEIELVRYCLKKYECGEICRIENVMRGECKEITRRNRNVREETESEHLRHAQTGQFEEKKTTEDLLNEIDKVLSQKKQTTTYKSGDNNLGGWIVDEDPAGGDLRTQATFARDIVARTAEVISHDVHRTRASRSMNDTEETIVQRYDNANGQTDILGIYRWINKIYSFQTEKKGDRLVMEIMLENPAKDYIENLRQYHDILLTKPVSPENQGLTDYSKISEEKIQKNETTDNIYYLDILESYDVTDIVTPPAKKIIRSIQLQGIKSSAAGTCDIPDGYKAKKAFVTYNSSNNVPATIIVGQSSVQSPKLEPLELNDEQSSIPVALVLTPTGTTGTDQRESEKEQASPPDNYYVANIEIECEATDRLIDEWKYNTYLGIMAGYRAKLDEYYRHTARQRSEISSFNRQQNNELELQQIKMKCMQFLLSIPYQMGHGDTGEKSDDLDIIDIGEPAYLQFLENALEWDKLSYYIYPDYGIRDNHDIDFPHTKFDNFLRAKKVRLLCPVKPGKTLSFLYFLASGIPWPGQDSLAPVIEDHLHIVNDLKLLSRDKRSDHPNREPWDITIPTSMVILQKQAGLPVFSQNDK